MGRFLVWWDTYVGALKDLVCLDARTHVPIAVEEEEEEDWFLCKTGVNRVFVCKTHTLV